MINKCSKQKSVGHLYSIISQGVDTGITTL